MPIISNVIFIRAVSEAHLYDLLFIINFNYFFISADSGDTWLVDGNLLVLRGGRLTDNQAAAKTRHDGRITFRDGRLLDSSAAGSDQWNAVDSSGVHSARNSWSRAEASRAGSDVSSSQRSVWSGGEEGGPGSAGSRVSTANLSSEHRRASTTHWNSQEYTKASKILSLKS
jgi:hypothetical protein